MDNLSKLIVQNQCLLDKLRVRALYCVKSISLVDGDSHKQYGPCANYWDDWSEQAKEMHSCILPKIVEFDTFLIGVKEGHEQLRNYKRLSKNKNLRLQNLTINSRLKLREQENLINLFDKKISLHQELVERILLVEALDGLSEDN